MIGFTGARNGMTQEQRSKVIELIQNSGQEEAVHGDCIGADEDFHNICASFGWIDIYQRPCTFESLRANTGAFPLSEPKPPMQRNRDIVADSSMMIACPPNYVKIKSGSGTWATIGFAERAKVLLYIVFPDGTVEVKNA